MLLLSFFAKMQGMARFAIFWREKLLPLNFWWKISLFTTSGISTGWIIDIAFTIAQGPGTRCCESQEFHGIFRGKSWKIWGLRSSLLGNCKMQFERTFLLVNYWAVLEGHSCRIPPIPGVIILPARPTQTNIIPTPA